MTTDRAALKRLWQQAFGDTPEFVDGFFSTGFSPERCRCLYAQGQLAAALYWFDCLWNGRKIAYIYAVATDKAFRGQGFCRRLMEDTHDRLQALGYAGAALVPVDAGVSAMYEKLGYRGFCPMEKQQVLPAGEAVCVRPVNPDVYARLRTAKLPQGGIIQEGDTLAFLASYARFYTGGGTLFCAARDGDALYFQEFFGDASLLPGIVASLQARRGIVRLPGGSKPFAMYRSFLQDERLPTYLGIALD